MQHYFRLRQNKWSGFVGFVAFVGLCPKLMRKGFLHVHIISQKPEYFKKSCRFLLLLTEGLFLTKKHFYSYFHLALGLEAN